VVMGDIVSWIDAHLAGTRPGVAVAAEAKL